MEPDTKIRLFGFSLYMLEYLKKLISIPSLVISLFFGNSLIN